MKRIVRTVAVFSILLTNHVLAEDNKAASELVERGRYLALAGDCVACHTIPGGARYAGGRALETPFGVIYSRNLTPDVETGLGRWSNADFYRALHEGLSRDGSHLYPAFPYTYFTRISKDDAAAIKAYLDTLAPVRNAVPPPKFPWPINQRGLMAVWNALFFHEGGTDPEPDRGTYLIEALGHCGACHTPKNFLGADKNKRKLQGGEILNWFSPSHVGDARSGLGNWSEEEIVEYLKSGRNVHSLAGGPMAEVVELSTSQLNENDLRAMAKYLKGLPPAGKDAVATDLDMVDMRAGEAIFIDECAGCHQASGEAVPRDFSPLKGSAVVQSRDPLDVIRLILQGTRAAATDSRPTPFTMPAFGWKLDDAQVAAVATYVRNSWGNVAPPVTAGRVEAARRKIAKEITTGP